VAGVPGGALPLTRPPLGLGGGGSRRRVVALRRLLEEFLEIVFSHDAHSGAKSASATRSLLRAWKRWDFDVPIGMLSVPLISSWVYPSTSCITNTVLYLSARASIALAILSFRSGSASARDAPIVN